MRDTTSPLLRVPEGGAARLFHLPAVAGMHPDAWVRMVANTPEDARPDRLMQRGKVHAILTHDEGLTWPSRKGEALADAVLAESGGPVALVFFALADALACLRRLREGAA
ncbi:MAG: hypothetical protein NZM27_03930 [Acetobacteraceae bacterium]|nr:hypothetical protein [Acetobacteraceae bacterium]